MVAEHRIHNNNTIRRPQMINNILRHPDGTGTAKVTHQNGIKGNLILHPVFPDPIEGSYTFEVSSAGADRVLKKPEHFDQFQDAEVEVKLYRPRDGRKEFVGLLRTHNDGDVTVEINGEIAEFTKKEIALVRLYPRF